METPHPSPGHPSLEPVLDRLRQRIRRVLGSRGLLITLVTALAALLVLVAVDFRFSPLPQPLRWALTSLWLALVAAAAFLGWWRPLRQPLDLVRIARWLEQRHPELDERVSTVLEVGRRGGEGMSTQLLDELAREAAAGLGSINPRLEVSARRARRWLWPALVLASLWAGLFVAWPDWTARHLVRALVPASRLGTAGAWIAVEPGSVELIEGDSLRVAARRQGGPPQPLEIEIRLADGTSFAEPLRDEQGIWIYQLEKATQGFEYLVRAGRETSDRFRVTVWPRPRIAGARVRLVFPAYTGLAPREEILGDPVSAVAGTTAEVTANLNTPLESARFEIEGAAAGATALEHSATGGAVTARWTLSNPGKATARLWLKHRLGREFEGLKFTAETLADAPPLVKWLKPAERELRVRPDDVLDLVYQASDDLGISAAVLEVEHERGEKADLPQAIPARVNPGGAAVWTGGIQQAVGDLVSRWPRARQFKLRVRIDDNRPADAGGPGSGASAWLTVRIDGGAPSLARQEVMAAHAAARDTVEEARRLVQQARERIDGRRAELRDGGKVQDYVRKELEEARERFAQARGKLQDLSEKVRDSVHAPKEKELREIAETVERARELLEEAPLQDTAPERDRAAADARDTASEAEQRLGQLRDEIQQAEPRVNDYARLKELEQQQRELAREAGRDLAASPPPASDPAKTPANASPPPPEWRQKQEQVENELRQQASRQPQTRAAALAAQAEEARDLASEARAQADAQKALGEIARAQADAAAESKPGNPPTQPTPVPKPAEALRGELEQEQKAIGETARSLLDQAREQEDQTTANALPDVVHAAETSAAAMGEGNDKTAAQQAGKTARQLAELGAAARAEAAALPQPEAAAAGQPLPPGAMTQAAKTAEALGELAGRQQQVAAALDQLQQGDTTAAAKQLAALRAEQAARLAASIRDAPQLFAPAGVMQQAAQEASQGAHQAAQAAAQTSPAAAAGDHATSANQLQQAAEHLAQAAAGFAQQADAAAAQAQGDAQSPTPGEPMARAFDQAARAADSQSRSDAASHAQSAADALASAARGTMQAMQGGPEARGQQADAAPQDSLPPPGGPPDESPRTRQADPGVPPELAKLGISAEDWQSIKSSLKSETAGNSTISLPEEYRDLVRRYFEQVSRSGNHDD